VKSKEIEKWAKDFGKEWEKWGEQYGEGTGKNWEKWGEQLGKDLEKWGEQYGQDWEKWGKQFGRDWEKWGKELGGNLEGLEGKSVEDIAKLKDILTDNLSQQIQGSITDNLRQSLKQLKHIKDLNLEGLEEKIQQAVQKSLSGIETMELSEKVLHQNLEKAGQNIFEATGQLQKLLDMKRDNWDLHSKEQWKALEKALKEMEINLPKLEGLEIEGMNKETLDDLLRQRIEKIKQEKSKAMSASEDAFRAQAKVRDAQRAEAIEKIKLEQDAIKLRDKDLQELQKQIEALKEQIRELKKENKNLEKEIDSDREREANRRFMM
jgi:archaellum component FlaC